MLNDDNNYKKGDKKMKISEKRLAEIKNPPVRDFIRLEYEARMKKEQEAREKARKMFDELGIKTKLVKMPKMNKELSFNQFVGKGFGIKNQAQYMIGPLDNFDGKRDSNATRLADYKTKAA